MTEILLKVALNTIIQSNRCKM